MTRSPIPTFLLELVAETNRSSLVSVQLFCVIMLYISVVDSSVSSNGLCRLLLSLLRDFYTSQLTFPTDIESIPNDIIIIVITIKTIVVVKNFN